MDFKKIFRNTAYGVSLALALLSFPNPISNYVNSFVPKSVVEENIVRNNNVNNSSLEELIESQKDEEVFSRVPLIRDEKKEFIGNNEFSLYNPYDVASFNVYVVRRIKDNKVTFHVYSKDEDLRRLETTVNNLNNNSFYPKEHIDLCKINGFERDFSKKNLSELIKKYSLNLNVDKNLVYAIVNNESLGYLNYDSDKAVAPLHVTFDTAKTLNRKYGLNKDLCNVEDNVYLGVLYIRDSLEKIKSYSEKFSFNSFPLRILFASYYAGNGTIDSFVSYVVNNNFDVSSPEEFDSVAKEYLERFYSNDVSMYSERALNTYTAFKNGNYGLERVDITNKILKESN